MIELVKTPIEKNLSDLKEHIYLGDWCDSNKDKTIKHPITDKNINEIYQEIDNVTEIILKELTIRFNSYFKINEKVAYYRTIYGRWIFIFISNIYEKILLLNKANNLFSNLSTKISNQTPFISSDSYEYNIRAMSSHQFNFLLYSSIISQMRKDGELKFFIEEILFNQSNEDLPKNLNSKKKFYLGKILLFINKRFHNNFSIITEPYYQKNYFFNSMWFFLKSRGKVIHYEFKKNKSHTLKKNSLRKKLSVSFSDSKNQLLKISSKLVLEYMPVCYVEDFVELRRKSKKWKKNNQGCKHLFTANSIHYNEFFKYLCANDQKIPLSIIQHGSGYGVDKVFSGEKYEIQTSNKFHSWGWSKDKLPHPKLKSFRNKKYLDNTRILITFPSFGIYLGNIETISLNYLNKENIIYDSNLFIDNISNSLKKHLIKRIINHKIVYNFKSSTNLTIDRYKSFNNSLLNSKIHVTNHFGTPFLESISMNFPTILFLKNYKNYLRDNVLEIFKELEIAKIIFDDPKHASEHINKHFDSIDSWWMSDHTQVTLKKFRSRFCFNSNKWKNEWLSEIIKNSN